MSLNITFRKNKNKNNLVAFATVEILGVYKVSGIKIWDNKGEYSVQLPGYSNTGKNGKKYYNPHFSFVNSSHTHAFNDEILSRFSAWITELENKSEDKASVVA